MFFYYSMFNFTNFTQPKPDQTTPNYKHIKNRILILLVIYTLGCKEKKTPQIADFPVEVIDFESLNENMPEKFIKNRSYINISTANCHRMRW